MTPDKPTTPPAPGPSTPATGSYHYLFQRVQIVGDLQSLPWRKINTTRRVHVRLKSTPDNPRTICGEPFDFIEQGSTFGRDMCISCAWLYDFMQAQCLVDLDTAPRQSIDAEPIMICTRCGVWDSPTDATGLPTVRRRRGHHHRPIGRIPASEGARWGLT